MIKINGTSYEASAVASGNSSLVVTFTNGTVETIAEAEALFGSKIKIEVYEDEELVATYYNRTIDSISARTNGDSSYFVTAILNVAKIDEPAEVALQKKIDAVNESVASIKEAADSTSTKVNSIDEAISSINENTTKISEEIATINANTSLASEDIETLSGAIQDLAVLVSEMMEKDASTEDAETNTDTSAEDTEANTDIDSESSESEADNG